MSIYAALRYRDAAAAIDWLERAFGFQTIARHEAPDGTIAHAELRLGESLIMLGQGADDLQDPPASPRAARTTIYVAVADVDGAPRARPRAPAPTSQTSPSRTTGRATSAPATSRASTGRSGPTSGPQAAAASPDSA